MSFASFGELGPMGAKTYTLKNLFTTNKIAIRWNCSQYFMHEILIDKSQVISGSPVHFGESCQISPKLRQDPEITCDLFVYIDW